MRSPLILLSPISSRPSEVRGLPARQGGGLCHQRPQLWRGARRDGVHRAGRVQSVRARPVHGHSQGASRPAGLGDHREACPGWTSPPAGAVQGNFTHEPDVCHKERMRASFTTSR